MNHRWLTIITITKDDPAGLARSLASAEPLRSAGAEQVVIDGGAPAAGSGVTGPASRGVTIQVRPAQGIADAFNAGLALAQGEWVWFLNGGDQVDSRLTPEFLFALLGHTRADVVIGGITYEGEAEPRPHPPREWQWPPLRSWIPHPATLVRRRLFDQFGGFDERYSIAMDYEWWLRALAPDRPVDVISAPFTVFAAGGISQQPGSRATIIRERDEAINRHRSRYWRAWLSSGGRLFRAWLRSLFTSGRRHPPRRS
jgi:Glycosyl transferase family 2